jgi:ubiquinone/menaquinone biosynthesis C-methylase UbiE
VDIIEQVPDARRMRRAYDFWSRFYDWVATPLEHGARMQAIEAAQAGERSRILEVASGTGTMLAEILKRARSEALVAGVEISPGMIRRAQRSTQAILIQADAARLPFRDGAFDLLYNCYMLDLMPLAEIQGVLLEFRRVLAPGGRLVLVNMSKEDPEKRTWFERLYRAMPSAWAAYLLGGCRPVLLREAVSAAGFEFVSRRFIQQAMPSEIVMATKPKA